jgi:CBS domain containing-hemolysin-like protein
LNLISNSVLSKYFKTKEDELRIVFSKDELGDYINEELANDDLSSEMDSEIQIFQNALDFSNVRAREVMVPRAEIISIDRYSVSKNLNKVFVENGLSKILIHRENIDHVVGYVSLFDMFNHPKNIKSIIHPVEFIPESMVIDEYGGTSGLITREDIMEELFGEIEDEHDSLSYLEEKLDSNSFIFSARLKLDYLNTKFKLNIPLSDQYETLGGFLVHNTQDIPITGEVLTILSFEFTVKEVTNTRIETIELKILN